MMHIYIYFVHQSQIHGNLQENMKFSMAATNYGRIAFKGRCSHIKYGKLDKGEIVNLLHFIGAVECSDRSGDERGNRASPVNSWHRNNSSRANKGSRPTARALVCSYQPSSVASVYPVGLSLSVSTSPTPTRHHHPELELTVGNLSSNQQSQKLPSNKTQRGGMLVCRIRETNTRFRINLSSAPKG